RTEQFGPIVNREVSINFLTKKKKEFVYMNENIEDSGVEDFKETWSNVETKNQIKLSEIDRKSTRLNSSHVKTSYAVSCLRNKKRQRRQQQQVAQALLAEAQGMGDLPVDQAEGQIGRDRHHRPRHRAVRADCAHGHQ